MCARAQRLGLVAVPTKPGVWEIHTADGMERVAEAGNLRACERWLEGYGRGRASTPYGLDHGLPGGPSGAADGNRQASVDSSAPP